MYRPAVSSLAFVLFQLLTATLFLRPAELLSFLAGLPLYEFLILGTLVLSVTSVIGNFRFFALTRQPISLCAVGLLVAIVLSHLTHFYLGGVRDSADQFARTLLYYALVVTCVNSPYRFKAFVTNCALCTGVMVTLCVLDYWTLIDLEFLVHLQDLDGFDEEDRPIFFSRMRGSGIFQDPNDLAMVMVAGGMLCLYLLNDTSSGPLRWAWGLPIVVFAVGIVETKSRGGLMAGAAAAMMWLTFRFGWRFGAAMGVLALMTLPVVAGRAANIDLSDGSTGHERIEMWREGFHALKSPDVLFGIGHNMFAELAGLVAHNSFVHTYVELGLVGGTLFFGCFFFAFYQIYRLGHLASPVWHAELLRFRPYMTAVLVGWCTSMLSLSRAYVVPTFLILGMAAAFLNLCWIHSDDFRPLVIWNRMQVLRLSMASAVMFVSLYAMTILFA